MKTLFYGGKILTMSDPMYAGGVLVEDGKITWISPQSPLPLGEKDCTYVDLQGAVMLPGFVDAHSHFFQVATSMLQVSLNGARSPEEMGQRIRDYISREKVQPGAWVIARDYDHNLLPQYQHPTLEQLNSFAPENPLIIHHKSGHMGLMNGKALDLLEITPETPDPEGGKIGREDGKLTGYLEENAFIAAIKRAPMPGGEALLQGFQKAQQLYASMGITTVQDGMVVKEMLPVYQQLLERNLLQLEVVLYCAPEAYAAARAMVEAQGENCPVRVGGMKIFLDGSPQGRTAWLRQPYAGEAEYRGYGTMTDEQVEEAFLLAARSNTQLLAHCNGDAAVEQFLRCLESVQRQQPNLAALRPVIIHGQLMGKDQMEQAARLGAVVSFFVAHVYHWGDVHIRNLGMERAEGISPAASALQAGIPVTFHQDSPVIPPDMLETVWCAVARRTESGVLLGEEERISVEQALESVTKNGAYQYFQEDRKGKIAEGMTADLVILSQDPLATPIQQLREIQVLQTYKNGYCVYTRQDN